MPSHQFYTGERMRMVLEVGTNNITVGGLNNMTLPGWTRQTADVSEFGIDFDIKKATSGAYTDVAYSGQFAPGDPGMTLLQGYLFANETIQDIRLYLDDDDFVQPNTFDDPTGGFEVTAHQPDGADKSGLIPFSGGMATAGAFSLFNKHYVDGATPALAFTTGASDTITGVPVSAGFAAGDVIVIEGSTSNDGKYKIESVATTTVTITEVGVFVAEAAIEGTTIHGGLGMPS